MIAFLAYQAAAEYVGVLLRGIPAAFEAGAGAVSEFVADHPVAVFAGLVALIMLWAFVARRGSG